jgi:hypothetical protein
LGFVSAKKLLPFHLRKFMRKTLSVALLPLYLAACGGGSGNGSSSPVAGPTATGPDSIMLSGQVVDGSIAGAQVCLFSDGVQVRNSTGAAVCSSQTDAQGYYTIQIPSNVALGFLTLVASKDGYVKLTSALGTFSQVMAARGSDGKVTPASLPGSRVTHFTTANLALADTNNDGTVSISEFNAYIADYSKVRNVAAVIKATIDFGQKASLIGGQTNDTLQLAIAAARNQTLGSTNKTAAQWAADPANATVIAAVDQDVATDMAGSFSNYQLSTVVTSSQIPSKSTANNGTASIGCEIDTNNESATVQIAFDAARGVLILKHDNRQTVGSYNPQTGAISLTENDPLSVSMVSSSGVTYYSEGFFKLNGTFDSSTGKITGTYSELSANTWSLDSTRQVCTAGGTVTATKL